MTSEEALAHFTEMKTAYGLAFGTGHEAVLDDLTRFCRGRATAFHPDPRIHAALEGRREVYLRIRDFLDRTPAELVEMFTKPLEGGKAND